MGNKEQTPFDFFRSNYEKVKDYLPPPKTCRYCKGSVTIKHHKDYYGKVYGKYPWLYACNGCGASVGIHPNTDIPLGVLADKKLRKMRTVVKERFITIKDDFDISTSDMYTLLSLEMRIPKRECHFGWFTEERLMLAGEALDKLEKRIMRRVNNG